MVAVEPTRVVHVRDPHGFDVYIGRSNKRFVDAPWGNPFLIGEHGSREQVISLFRNYLIRNPELIIRVPELAGQRLGCWCAPRPCHGDVLAEYADNLHWLWNETLNAVEVDVKLVALSGLQEGLEPEMIELRREAAEAVKPAQVFHGVRRSK